MDKINSNIITAHYVNEKRSKIKNNLKKLIILLKDYIDIKEEDRIKQNLNNASLFFLEINKAISLLFQPYDAYKKDAEIILINIEEKISIINVFLKSLFKLYRLFPYEYSLFSMYEKRLKLIKNSNIEEKIKFLNDFKNECEKFHFKLEMDTYLTFFHVSKNK